MNKDKLITKQEAHLWLSLHEFFTSEILRQNYEITQFRKKNLMQVNKKNTNISVYNNYISIHA